MGKILRYIFTAASLLVINGVGAQTSIETLREQIKQAEEDIRRNTELLERTQKDREVNQTQLKLVLSRISSRREIVTSLEKQMSLLQGEISDRERLVAGLEAETEILKREYAQMVREAYKNYRLNNFALFLFASEDFNDATRRIGYMRRYNQARELRARQLSELSDSLTTEIARLNEQREELDGTRSTHGKELDNLRKDETQYRSSVNKLQREESDISRRVRARQQEIEKAQQQIQRLIAEQAQRNRTEQRTEAEDRYITELSGRFDQNKGKLPFPVRGGVIIDRFGSHPHPTQRGLTVNNKGVNIAGGKGAEVTCVFEGTVSTVFAYPGYGTGVIVRHGNYMTVYFNLASVSVKSGDRLALNQKIGTLSNSDNSDDVYLHFEVWQETTNLNPEQWLHR